MRQSWRKERIGNLCTVGRGSSPRPIKDQRYFEGGNIPWIRVADATASERKVYKTREYVNELGASYSRLLPEGSLIICTSGTLGLPVFLGAEGCIHDGWLYTYDYKGIDKEFLYYELIRLREYFYSAAYGAAIQNINTDILRNTEILLPPLHEQIKIKEILSAYDDSIENNSRRIQLLEESVKHLYKEWFVRLRFPGYEHVKIQKGNPDGWIKGVALDFMDVLSGGTPKTGVSDYWDGGIPFYTPKDSVDSFYVIETEKTLSEVGLSKCNSKLYPKDTVFITARGTVGNLNLAHRPMAMNQSCYALKGKDDVSQLFLFCAVEAAINQFKQRASGAVFDAIVVDTFKLIPFLKPSKKFIVLFEGMMRPAFLQIENLLIQNQKLKQARDFLLPKLMNGEIAA